MPEMIEMVLCEKGKAKNGAQCWMLHKAGERVVSDCTVRLVGFYRVPAGSVPYSDVSREDALQQIAGAGGEWIGGEPLPPKCEPTYRKVLRPHIAGGRCYPWLCGNCTTPVRDDCSRCPGCGVGLEGRREWDPETFRNDGMKRDC